MRPARAHPRIDPAAVTPPPDFIIIGAQRAASTWLNDVLRQHPRVVSPRREVPYFEDPWFQEPHEPLMAIAKRAGPHQIWGFKRPNLLGLPECAPRIHTVAPRTKLLVTLREPIQRTISAYNLYVRNRFLPPQPLNVGLRRVLRGDHDGRHGWAHEVISFGYYATHLRRYGEYFPRESFHVILDDDLRRNHARTLREVFEFCGVEPVTDGARPPRRNEGIYSPARIRVHRLAARAIHTPHQDGLHMRTRLGLVPRALAGSIRLADHLLLQPWTGNDPQRLDDDVRRALIERFEPELDDLETLLGRSLDFWRTAMAGRPE